MKKKYTYLIIAIIVVSIAARIALPSVLLKYVEHQVNKIPEYKVHIADLSVQLWQGSYTIHQFQLWKVKKNIPVPFFSAETAHLSLEWGALLKGKFVGKIYFDQPKLNFVSDPRGANEQLTIDDQWLQIVKSLFPLNFNKIDIHNGIISYRSYHGNPPFNIYLKKLNMQIVNMQEVENKHLLLPSTVDMSAETMDGGTVTGEGKFNPFSKQPAFYLKLSLKNMNIKALAKFLKHFTAVDVESGKFNLYIELATANNNLKGYAKPFVKNLKIGQPKNNNPIEWLYDEASSLLSKIVENPKQKTIATKITITGKLDDPDTSILSIIGYVLRHAFIEALIPQVDNSVKMQSVVNYPVKLKK